MSPPTSRGAYSSRSSAAAAKAAAQLEKLAGAQAVLDERIAARTDKGKDAKGLSIHPDEPEAVVQPQKDKRTYAPSYKPVVLANRARVVVAGDAHPSCETAPVERLVEAARAHGKVETLLADSGFNGAGTIGFADKHDIGLLAPEGRTLPGETAGMVEPVFAHLKENQGLRRFRRRGLAKVRLELMLHLAAYNLSRAVVALAQASATLLNGLSGGLLAAALRCLAAARSALRAHRRRLLTALVPPTQGATHV